MARFGNEKDARWRLQGSLDKGYALQTPLKEERQYEDDDDDEDDDDIENDFVEMPRDMSYSSMDRDGYLRYHGSLQIPSSAVSSPAEECPPEAPYKRFRSNSSYLTGEAKLGNKPPQVLYRECQKNHAAGIGGHAVDGCGEFLPNGKEGTLEALMCAACSCHRNFHRREFVGCDGVCVCGGARPQPSSMPQSLSGAYPVSHALRPMSPIFREAKVAQLPSSADISPHAHFVPPVGQQNDDMEDDEEVDDDDEPPQNPLSESSSKKKRFRTKFTPEQKERMFDFAASLGWRISKHDNEAVQQFCKDVNVKRNVFKVWMHNNKARKLNRADLVGYCDSPLDY